MTLELWNTFATLGTFMVIAATAIAALVQLRHARGSNQIAALAELQGESQTPQFTEAQNFVMSGLDDKLKDHEFRFQIGHPRARTNENQELIRKVNTVGNFWESVGLLVQVGLVDPELALNRWSGNASLAWERLEPVAAINRRSQGDVIWENFEYFLVLSQDWLVAHPNGAYPAGVRRITLKDKWLETDKQYEASRAPA